MAVTSLWALLLLVVPAVTQTDRTREVGARGSALVEAVVAELHDACLYQEDNLFIRRLAYVQTRDGNDPDTYAVPGYDGGIWKVDQSMFQRTQTERGRLTAQYDLVRSKLGIDWSAVTWADLRRPLYSAVAAAMLLILEGAPANIPSDVNAQAAYWMTHFRKGQTSLTLQMFTDPASALQQDCARTEDVDLLFMVDTSSSVGSAEWSALTKFVDDIIINLSLHNGIGADKDRVAMVTFSDTAKLAFGFDLGTDLRTVLAQVSNSPRGPGATNISDALKVASTQVFSKARPNAAKVAVVITDGADADRVAVVMNLVPLKLSHVTVFTVGVGSAVSREELQQIASDPTCSHAYFVPSYAQLDSLHMAVERISCRVPVVLGPGLHTYPCGFNVLAQIQGGSVGSSLTVSTDLGKVNVWGSYTTQLPSQDVHDLSRSATAASAAVIFTRDPRPLTLSINSEKLQGLLCSGNFTVRVDSQAAKRTDCNKKRPDLVFLLDTTLAATDADWTAMLAFVQSFVQQFDVTSAGTHVALVSYSATQTTHFWLGQKQSTADVLQALRAIPRPVGSTSDLAAALNFVQSHIFGASSGGRADASKTLVVVTEGNPTDPQSVVSKAEALHAIGTRIVVVAVGSAFDDVHLNATASGPQHMEKVPDVTALTSVVGNVIKEACGAVSVLCVEGGITRECHIEDLINMQYGNLLGPDRTIPGFNPCAAQLATAAAGSGGVKLQRFPHPTETDRFLLCDSNGQAYLVLCPLDESYRASLHECRHGNASVTVPVVTSGPAVISHSTGRPLTSAALPHLQTTSTPPHVMTPRPTPSGGQNANPCTPAVVVQQQFFQPYPGDRSKYYHCTATPYAGRLESCPAGKVWYQSITQCIFPGVIVDTFTQRLDNSIPNPCTGGPGYFPAPQDHSSYIQCNANHEAFLMHCQAGTVWKQTLNACA